MKWIVRLGCLFSAAILPCGPAARSQGLSPDEAAGRMTVPEGLRVVPFASEPMIRQPVAIEFDDRGRLWVIQYLQYPNPAGLKRVEVDRYSRTVYDAVPPPPPRGPKGADRITILEDTDGDGRADSARDFVGGLNLASGLAFGHGGVFVLQVPYLLFYPDRDRDDVPDGDPEVCLSGFGMEDAHSVANSLTWGPDGWLYGLQGSTVTAHIDGQTFQQGVWHWRYHPISRTFELFCDGGGNMWGLDFDAAGNLFASTNVGGFLALHGVQGASCWKQFSKHGPLQNPYAFGYLDHVRHAGAREGHVAVGGLFYQADAFPERFRNRYIAGDLLGHAVRRNHVRPWGSTFETSHAGDLLVANDPWFAPTDLTLGPEGSIYVSDWHDRRTAHPDPDADWDRTNGRIFAIEATSTRRVKRLDLASKASGELVDLLAHPNVWYRRKARRLLTERRDRSVLPSLKALLGEPAEGPLALESLWTIAGIGGLDPALASRLLESPDEAIRAWTVRFLGETPPVDNNLSRQLEVMAAADPSPTVQSQLACTAKRLPASSGLAIAHALLIRPREGEDPHLPLLLWWAVERHAVSEADMILSRFATPEAWQSPIARDHLMGRLMRRYAAEGSSVGDAACTHLLTTAPTRRTHRGLLTDLDEGMRIRSKKTDGPQGTLSKAVTASWEAEPDDDLLCRLATRLGSQAAREHAMQRALDRRVPGEDRLALLNLWNELDALPEAGPLLRLAAGDDPEAIQLAALDVLKRLDKAEIASKLIAAYPCKGKNWRSRACDLLLSRKAWAGALLDAVERGEVPAEDVTVDQLRAVALHRDRALDTRVRKLWGAVKGETPGEKLAEVRRLNNDLNAGEGDAARGRVVYQKHCASCHRLNGEGNLIGPELTHANRADREFLLVSLVDPSSVVRKEYQSVIVETRDGRIVTGLVAESTPSRITIAGAKDERTTLDRDSIAAMGESPQSLMPDNLYRELSPVDLRDLFKYLQGDGPPSLPATETEPTGKACP